MCTKLFEIKLRQIWDVFIRLRFSGIKMLKITEFAALISKPFGTNIVHVFCAMRVSLTGCPCPQGDLWAECEWLGFLWHYYACMDGGVFDVTAWASCQVGATFNPLTTAPICTAACRTYGRILNFVFSAAKIIPNYYYYSLFLRAFKTHKTSQKHIIL